MTPIKPRVGITVGDPSGIGPEIALKSVLDPEVQRSCLPTIIGSKREILRQATLLGLTNTPPIQSLETLFFDTGDISSISWGSVSAPAGRAAARSVEAAVQLCKQGDIDAIATAPLNKEALKLSGSPYPGHTEMFASLCGVNNVLMSFFGGGLRVALLTIHNSLKEAISLITKQRVIDATSLLDRELQRFGIERPRIAVCGLNPHAGEHGLFGFEERDQIEPAIEVCVASGIRCSGPYPSDTLFVRAARGEFDAVIACYHDQGLIPVKCLAFGRAVNVTLGLPLIRTSVDHGTAFDIAGRGIAEPGSLIEAIKLAAELVHLERSSASASGS